jgi:hypothetical protein
MFSKVLQDVRLHPLLIIMPGENPAGNLPFKLRIDIRSRGKVRGESAGSAILKVRTSGEILVGVVVRL